MTVSWTRTGQQTTNTTDRVSRQPSQFPNDKTSTEQRFPSGLVISSVHSNHIPDPHRLQKIPGFSSRWAFVCCNCIQELPSWLLITTTQKRISATMTTSSISITAEINNITGTIAQIRSDYRLPCRAGFVCEGVKEASCSEIRDMFRDPNGHGLGDIFAGIWCPYDNNTLRNCPVGSYCPDPATKIECPAKKFCPHKV